MEQHRQQVLVQVPIIVVMAISVLVLTIMALHYIIRRLLVLIHLIHQQVFYNHHIQLELMVLHIQIICDCIVHNLNMILGNER